MNDDCPLGRENKVKIRNLEEWVGAVERRTDEAVREVKTDVTNMKKTVDDKLVRIERLLWTLLVALLGVTGSAIFALIR